MRGATDSRPSEESVPPRPDRALVAEPDASVAKQISSFLKRWGIQSAVVSDGGRALLRVFRSPPKLLIVGGHLPGVPGAVVTEILRRARSLEGLRIVRVTAIDEPVGVPEFEADFTIEPGDLPEGLAGALERFGIGRRPTPRVAAPAPQAAEPTAGARSTEPPIDPARSAPEPVADPRVAQAERLARIIVADIVLYNEDRFDRAVREGKLQEALKAELAEGSALFQARVPEDVRAQRDFVAEELERVSAKRLAKKAQA